MKLAEFFAQIGFKVDESGLEGFQQKMGELPKKFAIVAGAALAAAYAVDRFIDSSIRGAVALSNFQNQTGLSAQELQKWQIAAQMSNLALGTEEVTSAIMNLQKNITALHMGEGDASPFAFLQLDSSGGAFGVLEQLRERLNDGRLSSPIAVNMLERLGLGGDFINVLRLSKEEFDGFAASMSRTQKTQDALVRLGLGVKKLKLEASLFKDNLVAKLEPALNALIRVFKGLTDGVSLFIDVLTRGMASLKIASGLILALLAAMAVATFPITAAFAALFLILEDIAVYMRGGDSVFGDFIKFINKIGEAFDRNMVEPLRNVLRMLNLLPDDYQQTDGAAKEQKLMTLEKKESGTTFRDMLENMYNFFDDVTFKMTDTRAPIADMGRQAAAQNSQQTSFNNNFYINSTANPDDVASSISGKIQDQYSYSYDRLNKGLQA